jgi:hypothetical protein
MIPPLMSSELFSLKMKYFLFDDVVVCLHRVEKEIDQKYRSVNDICRYFTFSQFFQKSFEILKFNTRFFVLIFDFWK